MDISLEVVPRSREALDEALDLARRYPDIRTINIPDLSRFPLRAWDACRSLGMAQREAAEAAPQAQALAPAYSFIPHLRANAFNPKEPLPFAALFQKAGITAVLALAGDPPADPSQPCYPYATCDFIRDLKAQIPDVAVYAAFDPYRNNIRYELDYLTKKEAAGADGFFSQPFFDLRLLEIYAEYLEHRKVWWGVAPVVSDRSKAYWESRNRAIFPRSFRADLDWNVSFARDVRAFCAANDFNFYLMPIKVDLDAYLGGLFG